jgi:chorismate synthase
MAGSSFGKLITLNTFGESHGEAIGGILDGFPSNFELDFEAIQTQLNRRKPGQSKITTQRKEADEVKFLSGIFEGKTTGTPIAFIIENTNQKSTDYTHLENAFRPSHADFTYFEKYTHYDYRGGGRSSARETAIRVVAGAICEQYLAKKNIQITAFVDQVGALKTTEISTNREIIDASIVRCPDLKKAKEMQKLIEQVRKKGDTIGGAITCIVTGVPIGLGEPIFDKLNAVLAHAICSINAVKGFEVGRGFEAIELLGSQHNDLFNIDGTTKTNNSGGIQGGISNGMPIVFRAAFKPVATLLQKQPSITKTREEITLDGKGRHDPCVVPRAVPIVEAMTALVLMDFYLLWRAYQVD